MERSQDGVQPRRALTQIEQKPRARGREEEKEMAHRREGGGPAETADGGWDAVDAAVGDESRLRVRGQEPGLDPEGRRGGSVPGCGRERKSILFRIRSRLKRTRIPDYVT